MKDLSEIVRDNDRTAERELAEARESAVPSAPTSVLTDAERVSLGLPANARPVAVEVIPWHGGAK